MRGYDVIEIHGAHGYLLAHSCRDQQHAQRPVAATAPAACAFRSPPPRVRSNCPSTSDVHPRLDGRRAGGWEVEIHRVRQGLRARVDVIDCSRVASPACRRPAVKRSLGFQVRSPRVKRQPACRPCVGLILDGRSRGDPAAATRLIAIGPQRCSIRSGIARAQDWLRRDFEM